MWGVGLFSRKQGHIELKIINHAVDVVILTERMTRSPEGSAEHVLRQIHHFEF